MKEVLRIALAAHIRSALIIALGSAFNLVFHLLLRAINKVQASIQPEQSTRRCDHRKYHLRAQRFGYGLFGSPTLHSPYAFLWTIHRSSIPDERL